MKTAEILGLIGLVLFALIQLVPYGRSHKNPACGAGTQLGCSDACHCQESLL